MLKIDVVEVDAIMDDDFQPTELEGVYISSTLDKFACLDYDKVILIQFNNKK